MSSKRQRGATSRSSRVAYDHNRFVSEEAAERFHNVLASKTLVMERGLKPDANHDGEMALQIAERNWFDVTEQPGPAVISIVKEFYANAINAINFEVQVRGQSVSFSSHTINAYFNVENHADTAEDYLSHGIEEYNLDTLVSQICRRGTTWTRKGGLVHPSTFPQTALSRYGKAWYSFICSNLMPTTHRAEVNVERAVLLFALVTDLPIDVGSVIVEFITTYLTGSTTGSLPFPSLITGLCRRAGVYWGNDEVLQPPMAPIDHTNIERYRVWDGALSHPRGKGFLRLPNAPMDDQEEQPEQEHTPSLEALQDAIVRIEKKVDRQSRRQNRKMDALAHRLDAFLQFNMQFAHTLSQLHSGGDASSSSGSVKFPDPPTVPDYPDDSPDEENDADA